ncbi:MAG: DnaJ- protein scj1 [Alyxoria varia]|nr:MAG: DnaJ- protein scj1 [Alyxoria varia]
MIPTNLLLICILALVLLVAAKEDFYQVLGVKKQATERELKKAYRSLSKKFHPDKNPEDETAQQKFLLVSEAYDALSNAETRKIYDTQGHAGLERHKQSGGRSGGHNPFDLFAQFFGGGGHFQQGTRRGPDIEVRVHVPLKDFYNGVEESFSVRKQTICQTCEGSGSSDGKLDRCGHCGGRGVTVQKHMLAPGIFQQVQSACEVCGGKGETIKHPCKVCGGHKVVETEESFDLRVERGMPRGIRISYENDAHESPDWVPGDMHVIVTEKPVEEVVKDANFDKSDGTYFRRRGADLFWREVLSLREAWMGGWSRNLTHLDGHVVRLGRERAGGVIQPGFVEILNGEGMPIWRQPDHEDDHDHDGELKFGNLHIEYTVVLPDQMDKSQEKEFWNVWEKWRGKKGVDLGKLIGKPEPSKDGAASKKKAGHEDL